MRVRLVTPGELQGLKAKGRAAIHRAVLRVSEAAHNKWIDLAKQKLHTSSFDYRNGIKPPEDYGTRVEIPLVGWIPNAVEHGITSFDIKVGLLNSKKAKSAKDGSRYITVPLRHGMGEKVTGRNFPKINPHRDESPAQAMRDIHDAGLFKKKGIGAFPVPARHIGGKGLENPLSRAKLEVKDIYAGLKVMKKPPAAPGGKSTSQAMTFRRVSSKTPPDKWIHPGISARKLMNMVSIWAEFHGRQIIKKELEKFL